MKDLWYIAILYFFVAAPVAKFNKWTIGTVIGTWVVRAGDVCVAAFSHYGGGQPYCKMPGLYGPQEIATSFVDFN